MARVRILSGNQAGAILEMNDVEAQAAVSTGFAELLPMLDRGTRRRLAAEAKIKAEAEAKAKKLKADDKPKGR